MRKISCGIVLLLALILTANAYAVSSATGKNKTVVWSGTVQVKKTYTVSKGKTLEIRPGSRILFAKGTSLLVLGTLKAVGRKGEEIVFTSADKSTAGSWHELKFDSAGASVLAHCIIENATWGLHSHFTRLLLNACTISKSEVGLRFQGGPLTISNCHFIGNRIGLRSYQGVAQISESDFTDNEIGIFVREKGSGLKISRSNLYRNSAYNIRIGDFNNEDVEATENWWGEGDPAVTLFDARNEPDIGHVLFEPFSKERIPW